jgi:hypothetical protein
MQYSTWIMNFCFRLRIRDKDAVAGFGAIAEGFQGVALLVAAG